jgi:hypothetical protein
MKSPYPLDTFHDACVAYLDEFAESAMKPGKPKVLWLYGPFMSGKSELVKAWTAARGMRTMYVSHYQISNIDSSVIYQDQEMHAADVVVWKYPGLLSSFGVKAFDRVFGRVKRMILIADNETLPSRLDARVTRMHTYVPMYKADPPKRSRGLVFDKNGTREMEKGEMEFSYIKQESKILRDKMNNGKTHAVFEEGGMVKISDYDLTLRLRVEEILTTMDDLKRKISSLQTSPVKING